MTALDDPGSFDLKLPVHVRQATREDVPRLEWFGQYTHFRNLIRRAYKEQARGSRLMLVADFNGFPVGQVFIQLAGGNTRLADGAERAYLYAFRVLLPFRGLGIGTHLMYRAEGELTVRGYRRVTIAVAKDNFGARRLYERLGYAIFAEEPGRWSYVDHLGVRQYVHEPCWLMLKRLENG